MDNNMIEEELVRDDQTMNTIQQIDKEMQNIYNNLEALSVERNPNMAEQGKLLKKIQELQALKSSLYNSLSYSYASTQANVAEARNSLVNEVAVSDVIKNELDNAKHNLSSLKDARFNKLRMAEINNYYSEKYSAQATVMKTIVYYCIPVLILGILTKKEFIPSSIGIAIIGLLIGLAIFTIGYQLVDIASRDNMVFSEFDFPFNPENVDLNSESNSKDQPGKLDMTLSCAGEECCPSGNSYGTVWDEKIKKCISLSDKKLGSAENKLNSELEGFVGEKCLQSSFDKPNTNINVFGNNDNVQGYSNDNQEYTTV